MLSRVVENVYWLARYLERAENTARLIGVNTNLLLDLPPGYAPGWLPLVDISGNRAGFGERYKRADERDIVQFLIADLDNPGSIATSLRLAREDARGLRDVLPNDAWELLNGLFADFTEALRAGLSKRARYPLLSRTISTLQAMTGKLDGIMNRNEAYTFLVIGRNLERADMTSRIVDVRSAQLLPQETTGLRPFESVQWMSVLKSLSGYQMYRLKMRTRISRTDVLDFLLRDLQFPRACQFCLVQAQQSVAILPRNQRVIELLQQARDFIDAASVGALDQDGLHRLIDDIQLHVSEVHAAVADCYFPARPAA